MPRNIDPARIEVVDDAIAEILRQKTPAERVQMIFDADRTMRLVLEGHLRGRFPDWSDARIQRAVVRRMFGEPVRSVEDVGPRTAWRTHGCVNSVD